VIVFRYCLNNLLPKKTIYNNEEMYLVNSNGLITFSRELAGHLVSIKEYFNIYVGLVSAAEDIYKNEEIGNIEVLNAENVVNKYIYAWEFPMESEEINQHLLANKNRLINRAIRKFTEKNWYEWGAPRNLQAINDNWDKPCIYVTTITRQQRIAFVGRVQNFGGSLIMMLPKNNVTNEQLIANTEYLNSLEFRTNFIQSGRFKISHRQLAESFTLF
jgi:hypothetical protein